MIEKKQLKSAGSCTRPLLHHFATPCLFLATVFMLITLLMANHQVQASIFQQSRAGAYAAYMTGLAEIGKGDLEEGIKWLEKAYEQDPNSIEILEALVRTAAQLKDRANALKWLKKAIELDPDNPELLLIRARLLAQENRVVDAISAIQQVLRLQPENQEALLLAGTLYIQARDIKKAAEIMKKAASIQGNKAFMAYYFLGRMAEDQGRLLEAEDFFRKAMESNPLFLPSYFDLASLYQNQKMNSQAIAVYMKLLEVEPQNVKARQSLLMLLMKEDRDEEMVHQAEILRQLGATSPALDFRIALTYLKANKLDQGIRLLKDLADRDPENSDFKFYLALALEEKGDLDRALELYSQIMNDPEHGRDAAVRTAMILRKKERIGTGIQVLQEAIAKYGYEPDLASVQASFLEESGRLAQAAALLEQALEQHPNNERLLISLALILEKQGKWEKGVKLARKVLKINPDDVSALNFIGYTLADRDSDNRKSLEEAEKLIKKALELRPEDGFIMDSMGWVYFKQHRYCEAIRYLRKAHELAPDDPVIAEHLGDALMAAHRFQDAVKAYEKSVQLCKKRVDRLRIKKKLRRAKELLSDYPDL